MNPIVSDEYHFVIGVDTHAATHTLALINGATGAELNHAVFPTHTSGLGLIMRWIAQGTGGHRALVVVEGTGSYGTTLTQRLQAEGIQVVEAARMTAGQRRGQGKHDDLDALRIARAVLPLKLSNLRTPRKLSSEENRVALRVLVVARDQLTNERTRAVNTLTALARTPTSASTPAGHSPVRRSRPSASGANAKKASAQQPAAEKPSAWPAGSVP